MTKLSTILCNVAGWEDPNLSFNKVSGCVSSPQNSQNTILGGVVIYYGLCAEKQL